MCSRTLWRRDDKVGKALFSDVLHLIEGVVLAVEFWSPERSRWSPPTQAAYGPSPGSDLYLSAVR